MQGFPWWCLEHLGEDAKWAIEDIGAHLSNRTWLVTQKQSCALPTKTNTTHKFIVKQFQNESEFARNNQAVIRLDKYIADQGLGPQVVFVSNDYHVIAYEHIEQPMVMALDSQQACIEKLAEALVRIHQLTPEVASVPVRSQMEQYCKALALFDETEAM